MTRPRHFTVAAVQMTSTADRDKNLALVEYMAGELGINLDKFTRES